MLQGPGHNDIRGFLYDAHMSRQSTCCIIATTSSVAHHACILAMPPPPPPLPPGGCGGAGGGSKFSLILTAGPGDAVLGKAATLKYCHGP